MHQHTVHFFRDHHRNNVGESAAAILLQKTLKTKFSIERSIQRVSVHKNKYSLYFKKNRIFSLYSIVNLLISYHECLS